MDNIEYFIKQQKELIRQANEMYRSLDPMYDIIESLRKNEVMWKNQLKGIDKMTEWEESLSNIFKEYNWYPEFNTRIFDEVETWKKTINQINIKQENLFNITLPSTVWQESVSQLVEGINQYNFQEMYPQLTSNLMVPSEIYSKFTQSQLLQLDDNMFGEEEAIAISGSILLAEEQLSTGTKVNVEVLNNLEDEEHEEESDKNIIVNLFEEQKTELLENAHLIETVSSTDLFRVSPSSQIACIARNVTKLAIKCNQMAKMNGRKEIFKPTTKYIEAQNQLQWLIVKTEMDLGIFIDSLYLMLYEGGGKDSLRFMDYLEDDDCSIIWVIKHLRNKLFRHDSDHGKESSQRKSWRDLKKSLGFLGFDKLPIHEEELSQIQKVILNKTESFLESLYEEISI